MVRNSICNVACSFARRVRQVNAEFCKVSGTAESGSHVIGVYHISHIAIAPVYRAFARVVCRAFRMKPMELDLFSMSLNKTHRSKVVFFSSPFPLGAWFLISSAPLLHTGRTMYYQIPWKFFLWTRNPTPRPSLFSVIQNPFLQGLTRHHPQGGSSQWRISVFHLPNHWSNWRVPEHAQSLGLRIFQPRDPMHTIHHAKTSSGKEFSLLPDPCCC